MWWGFNYLAACRGVIQVTKFTLTFETLGTDLIEFLSLYPWNLFLRMLEQKRWTELYAKGSKGSKGSKEVQINILIMACPTQQFIEKLTNQQKRITYE